MVNGKQMGTEDGQLEKQTQPKKLYQKPAFRFERVFEMQALSCGKVLDTIGQCRSNRKNS
jgi:hypothetical protein